MNKIRTMRKNGMDKLSTFIYRNKNKTMANILRNYQLYILVAPAVVFFIIFHYAPMYGVQIAFKDFNPAKGIWGSQWVGMGHIIRFVKSFYFWTIIKNTLGISLYSLAVGFPIPIIVALMFNEVKNHTFKRVVQTVTYAPHFISMTVMVGMLLTFLSPTNGIVNNMIKFFGFQPILFMGKPEYFKSIYVFSGIWQSTGWGTIIYLAALTGIDIQLYEAAIVDGATRLQRIRNISLPGIMPTVVIMMILSAGSILNVGFEKIYLMQNSLNNSAAEVISTYTYKAGLLQAQYSFSAAIGLMNSAVNFFVLVVINTLASRVSEHKLW